MRKLYVFLIAIILLLLFCLQKGLMNMPLTFTTEITTGNAQEISAIAHTQIQKQYPNAILIGMNNSNSTFNALTHLPETKNIDGNDVYWYFLFAKDENAFADEVLYNDEMIGIIFNNGLISYHHPEEMKVTIPKNFDHTQFADYLDTTTLVEDMRGAIKTRFGHTPELWHMEFNALPAEHRLTWFRDETRGYEGVLNVETGEVEGLVELSFIQK